MNILIDIRDILLTPYYMGRAFVDARPAGSQYREYARGVHAELTTDGKVVLCTKDNTVVSTLVVDQRTTAEMSTQEAKLWFARGVNAGLDMVAKHTRTSMVPALKAIRETAAREAARLEELREKQMEQEAAAGVMPPVTLG